MGRRGRAIAGLLVVAVAIAVVVGLVLISGGDEGAPPIGAVVAVQDDHLPVDPIEKIPERLDLLADTGVTTTRVDLFWADIAPSRPASPTDPTDPAYDFSRADLIFLGLAERGITPIVSVYYTPRWASGGRQVPGIVPNTLAPDPQAFADFMQALATRYDGTFTSPGGETLPEVDHFEIWNEPNLSGFFTPQFEDGQPVSLDAYAAMDRLAYPAIKRANPQAVVIAGVCGPRGRTGQNAIGAIDWLRGLVERRIPLDAYSQHIYPAAPPTEPTDAIPSWSSVGRLLDEIDAFDPGLPPPLYITEAGYTTAATAFRDVQVTDEQQAEYLTQIYSLPQIQTDRVKAVVWFNLQDNPNWPGGLLREDLSRKPSYQRFLDAVDAQKGRGLTD
jgi:hypothetical protein